jgi:hypothetical protein
MSRTQLARAALAAVLVVMLAVAPLTAMFRPAHFEAWLEPSFWYGPPKVVLEDRTGLVSGMVATDGPAPASAADRVLAVSWLGGCDEQVVWLTFESFGSGYRLDKRTASNGCVLLMGLRRTLILVLRAPVDPSTVEFEELESSVR